jgi:two-component system sensor histidine kinase TctE
LKSRTPASNPLSLLVEILDWLLAPLIILWPLSVVVTFWIANAISNIPYDRALADSVNALARHVSFGADKKGGVRFALPAAASSFLRTDELDTIYFQVRGTRGEVLAGDRDLAEIFPEEGQAQHIVYFGDAEWHGDPVRVAYMFMFDPQAPHRRVVVQVGETLNKRQRLSNEIIAGIIIPQFFLFPVVALLAWFGLQRGTQPLERLRQRLLGRRPGDLSPIDVREVPEEVAPLIEAFNGVMERLSTTMRAQERFIADAAHQMRTPLAGLRTQLEFALRQKDPADLRASLERIRSSVERATRMISQLLSLARSQSETPPKFEPVNLNALARSDAGMGRAGTRQAHRPRLRGRARSGDGRRQPPPAARAAQQPGRQRGALHPAGRPGHRARGCGQLDARSGDGRDRGRRRRHRRVRPRADFRALLSRRGQ